MRTALLTGIALFAFAANSILCRLALGGNTIDAASFTTIRIASGAAVLLGIVVGTRAGFGRFEPLRVVPAFALYGYAIFFSFAYRSLTAGTGALLLFGAVQVTMIGVGLARGERPRMNEWLGLVAAVTGLAVLVAPDLASPAPLGAAFMVMAGIAWGVYSLAGKGVRDPVAATATNFLLALPLAAVELAVAETHTHVSRQGITLAVASGAIASGLGYVVWFAALRGLSATRAATVQLAVPVIAGVAGILLLGESFTGRLVAASALILGGVWLAITGSRAAGATDKRERASSVERLG